MDGVAKKKAVTQAKGRRTREAGDALFSKEGQENHFEEAPFGQRPEKSEGVGWADTWGRNGLWQREQQVPEKGVGPGLSGVSGQHVDGGGSGGQRRKQVKEQGC